MASTTLSDKRKAASPISTQEELSSAKRINTASSPERLGNDREPVPRRLERGSLPAELVNQKNKLVKDYMNWSTRRTNL
ncbi:hypothetical protein BDV97DRAFT_349687 [Delphinella strobiligena]|nr:hypothetical protein BDV97DRAFT_349687 [Delphinella strobiligena]